MTSLGRYFSRIWLAILILFVSLLVVMAEYKKAVKVHTQLIETQDTLKYKVKALEER